MSLNGIGRKPQKNAVPQCEKPWFWKGKGRNNHNKQYIKDNFIRLLETKGYRVVVDNTDNKKSSRLYKSYHFESATNEALKSNNKITKMMATSDNNNNKSATSSITRATFSDISRQNKMI